MFIKYCKVFYPTESILEALHVKELQDQTSYSCDVEDENLAKMYDEAPLNNHHVDTSASLKEVFVVLDIMKCMLFKSAIKELCSIIILC